MQSAYLDASALVKLVVAEVESSALERALASVDAIFTSEIAHVEVARGLRRIAGDESLVALGEHLLAACAHVPFDTAIRRAAARSPTSLATLDAIHLASVLSVRDVCETIVTYDRRLGAASGEAGLTVVAPGQAPR